MLVEFDDAARDGEIAVGAGESSRIQPERVLVLRPQRHRHVTRDGVEVVAGGLWPAGPVAAAPAVTDEPSGGVSARNLCCGLLHSDNSLGERDAALEPQLPLREGPGRVVDVGVAETRDDAAPAEIDSLRPRQRRLVRADASRDAVTCDGEGRRGRKRELHRADRAPGKDHA